MHDKTLLCCCLLLLFLLPLWTQEQKEVKPTWYVYSLGGRQIGRAAVGYLVERDVVRKKKLRYRSQGSVSYEEYSAVLNRDFSLCSLSLKTKEQGQNEGLWVITVSDRIVIQTPEQVLTLPGQKLYLEIEDWLRQLFLAQPVTGKVYQGALLASNRREVTRAKARYMGAVELPLGFYTHSCHAFKVITQELKNFWAEAWLDQNGNLVSYRLGSFIVLPMPSYWQAEYETHEAIAAPMVFDVADISRIALEAGGDGQMTVKAGDYQKMEGQELVLHQLPPPPSLSLETLAALLAQLTPFRYAPLTHPLIRKTAAVARQDARTPLAMIRNITGWVSRHMVREQTPSGLELAMAFAFVPEAPALTVVALCRDCGIPARVTAGLRYHPGRWVYTCWPEVYLKAWYPLDYSDTDAFAGGASFLALLPDTTWIEQKQPPALALTMHSVVKKGRLLDLAQPATFCLATHNVFSDWLLGIGCDKPAGWDIATKDITSDFLLWHGSRSELILCKIFALPKPLNEIIASLQKKMGEEEQWQVLWQARRDFAQGNGLELALKSPRGGAIYRAFLAEKGCKGVLLLLIAAPDELAAAEKSLQTMVVSLKLELP
jgi:hypothetical protein